MNETIQRKLAVLKYIRFYIIISSANVFKKETPTDTFMWNLRVIQEHLFYRTPPS